MTRRIDVTRDERLWKSNQLVTNEQLWREIRLAAGNGNRLGIQPHPPTLPPVPPPPYGTAVTAGELRGRGIMLGGNPDVWDQARALARAGQVDVVAVPPGGPSSWPCRFVYWLPPEQQAENVYLVQAENQPQWDTADHSAPGIILNNWIYGRLDGRKAMVETYYNEGWGVDFGVFTNYTTQGASAVVPLCGGYPALGRTDAEAARLYAALAKLPFPGFWMYAGEDLLTPESIAVLTRWPAS